MYNWYKKAQDAIGIIQYSNSREFGYWINSSGLWVKVNFSRHADFVIKNPDFFGITSQEIKETYKLYKKTKNSTYMDYENFLTDFICKEKMCVKLDFVVEVNGYRFFMYINGEMNQIKKQTNVILNILEKNNIKIREVIIYDSNSNSSSNQCSFNDFVRGRF